MRIGIDVGGTNTDAVLMEGHTVKGQVKTPTTPDVTTGITTALKRLLEETTTVPDAIQAVMIGTTHFTNAVVERKRLMPIAAIRVGLPAGECLPPMVDWPGDLRDAVGGHRFMVHGGYEFDGRPIAPYDEGEVRETASKIRDLGVRSIAISSIFSPVNADLEQQTAEIVRDTIPDCHLSLSHEIGRIGLLERENAAIMNSCLRELAMNITHSFQKALAELQVEAPFYISQNDGTLMSADFAERYPVFTFASGPTNSMRGAAFLSGIRDCIVVDVGGTTTDLGMLINGFPREASVFVEIGGVRTNFRMPDVFSFGLGGGSIVEDEPFAVGPQSVGYRLTEEALVFGGDTLTATDAVVAAGQVEIGDPSKVSHLEGKTVEKVVARIREMVEGAIDRVKTSRGDVPVVVVGGGSILLSDSLKGASEVIKPNHFAVANAIGAAIAQVGGEVDRVFSLDGLSRGEALETAKKEAREKASEAGATKETIEIVEVEEIPLTYLPSNAIRIRVKAVGDLAMPSSSRGTQA